MIRSASVIQLFLFLFICNSLLIAQSPGVITIQDAWRQAKAGYPLTKQKELLQKSKDYTVQNAAKGYLPVLSFSGQLTYQSAVTSFPFTLPVSSFKLPSYSKDQYRFFAEADQLIYDGGLIRYQKEAATVNEQVQQQSLEVQLYALYDRINQLFFGAYFINEQLKQNTLLKQDIQNGLDKTKALVANGVALRSSADELSAQLLQADQTAIELKTLRKAYLDMLGLFINQTLDDNTVLNIPPVPITGNNIARPELSFYDAQTKMNDLQLKMLSVQLRPKLSLFLQSGYGRPGLNMLNNEFAWYYIGGVRANWDLGSLYTLKNQRRLININHESVALQKETFLFNTNLQLTQQNNEINKYKILLRNDDDIIVLRQSVKKVAAAQLENGVLSAHDYLNQVIAEDLARQNRILHQVQLLQAQYSYQNVAGQVPN